MGKTTLIGVDHVGAEIGRGEKTQPANSARVLYWAIMIIIITTMVVIIAICSYQLRDA